MTFIRNVDINMFWTLIEVYKSDILADWDMYVENILLEGNLMTLLKKKSFACEWIKMFGSTQ